MMMIGIYKRTVNASHPIPQVPQMHCMQLAGLGRMASQQDRKGKIKNSYAMVCIVYL